MKKTKFPSEVTVASLQMKQIFEFPNGINGDDRPNGSEGRLVHLLSEALRFKYKLITPVDKQWGRLSENGTWTGLIGLVSKREADLAACFIGATEDRKTVVDFTEPYSVNELTFATDFPKFLHRAYVYMYPYDITTWMGISILLIVMPLIFRLLTATRRPYSYLLLKMYGTIFTQPVNETDFNSLFMLGSWWCFATVISAGYAAVLASFLAVPMYDSSVKDFDELAKAVRNAEYKVVTPRGSAILPAMYNSGKENLIYIAEAIEKSDWFIPSNKYMDEDNFNSKTAVLGVRLMFYFKFGSAPLTTKFISDHISYVLPVGMAVNKQFCCKDALDSSIKKINEAGLYKKIVDDELYKAWFQASKEDLNTDNYHPLNVDDISGALTILIIGYFLSFNIILGEIISFRFLRRFRVHEF